MREQLQTLRIGVLMGGVSREREVSLRSGSRVLESLLRQGFQAIGIDVDHHIPERLRSSNVNFAFIALHGRHGEDGTIQGLLEILGIPYTGSGVLASALGMNKVTTKRLLATAGVPTAPFALLDVDKGVEEEVQRVERELGLPLVVKPVSEGSSIGVHIADSLAALQSAVRSDLYYFGKILIEKFVPGREVSVGVLGTNGTSRALPVLELRPKNRFYDYEAKYTKGLTEFVLPAELPDAVTHRVQEAAVTAHRALGCRGFSRVDAIVAEDGTPFVLEVNTIPGLTELSDLPAQAAAAGMSFDDLIFEILKTAYVENHPQRTTAHDDLAVPLGRDTPDGRLEPRA
jgi:D-alanine-D-alanine ligase